MFKKIALVLLLLAATGCSNTKFLVCGLDVTNMKVEDYGVAIAGAVVSVVTHVAGHYLAAELFNVNFNQVGTMEVVNYNRDYSDSDLRWFARGGFVLQVGVNLALTSFFEDSYFTKGYTAMTAAELLTYLGRRQNTGDFRFLDEKGGDGDLEHLLYLGLTGYNVFKLSMREIYVWQ